MNIQPFVLAQFCDDIRHEIGNKFSLMGCYTDELIVNGPLPALLPKLCAQVRAVCQRDEIPLKLTFRLILNNEVLAELEVPKEQLTRPVKPGFEDSTRRTYMAHMVLSPLPVQEPSILRVEAETDSGVIAGSKLHLRSTEPEVNGA
jgi:hypothetical protein